MSIKKTKRSKTHRPRHVDHIGGLAVIYGKQHVRPDQQTEIGVTYWLAFDSLVRGQPTENHWAMIAVTLNAALILAERGLGKEYVPYVVVALDEMFECKLRAERTGAWRFSGPGMCAVRSALEVIDEQIKYATQEQIRQALIEADLRALAGHAYFAKHAEERAAA